MPRPIVVQNNLLLNENTELKCISKVFILCESVFGINRLSLYTDLNTTIKHIIYALNIVFHLIIITMTFNLIRKGNLLSSGLISLGILQYYSTIILAVLYSENILTLLRQFDTFDYSNKEFSSPLNKWRECIKTILKLLIIVISIIITYLGPLLLSNDEHVNSVLHVMILETSFDYELLFYTYLFENIYIRIKFLADSLEVILNESFKTNDMFISNDVFNYKTVILQSEKSYNMLAVSGRLLYQLTKWQMTVGVVAAFIPALINGYFVALGIVQEELSMAWVLIGTLCGVSVANNLYCFSGPCFFSGQIQAEVENIKRIASSFMCRSDLDKEAKQSTREFVNMLENLPIKFTLLRMVDMDKLLPLQFVSLVVEYLIILLQFGKFIENTLTDDFIHN